MQKMKWMLPVLLVSVLGFTGCPGGKKSPVKEPTQTNNPADDAAANAQKANGEEPSLRGKEYREVPELEAIRFDLDQSTLRADARASLQKNYDILRQHSAWEVLVEGHCDQRGTTEYNLALGQRRAASVRSYYIGLGLSAGKIATISYGKESPICEESTEECWSKNRRGLTKVREGK